MITANHGARNRRRSTFALIAIACTAVGCAAANSQPERPGTTAEHPERSRVLHVVDGDTITVRATGARGGVTTVRVLGIDTPETHRPGTPVQCWGPEASRFADGLLRGQTVTLTQDQGQADRDRYRRALRYVTLADGRDYSVAAAAAGAARPYTYGHRPVHRAPAIEAAAAQAHQHHRGLWGPPCHGQP